MFCVRDGAGGEGEQLEEKEDVEGVLHTFKTFT